MQLTPVIAIHMAAASAALVIGPVVLWARRASLQRPKLHRAFGYAWVTLMIATAITALFIRDFRLPNIAGYTPIHLMVPFTLYSLVRAFQYLAAGNVAKHKQFMQGTYAGLFMAGAFTLMPGRYLSTLFSSTFGLS